MPDILSEMQSAVVRPLDDHPATKKIVKPSKSEPLPHQQSKHGASSTTTIISPHSVPSVSGQSGSNAKKKNLSFSSAGSRGDSSEDFKVAVAGTSLLGSEELEKHVPTKKVKVQVTTWNMGSLPLPKEHELRKLFSLNQLDENLVSSIDIYVVCIQECWPDVDAWELELQVCLGPSYALFHSLSFGTLHISVFLKRELLWFTTEPSDWTISVRSGRLFKTKGSAGIYFNFFGTKFLFATAHLSAGEEKDRERTRLEELVKIMTFYNKSFGSGHVDCMFFCGDLNFRISGMKREEIVQSLRNDQLQRILDKDELREIFRRVDTLPASLNGFQEAAFITFRPTYKYDIGTDKFDTSNKRRAPAYTDRIMYRTTSAPSTSNNNEAVVCLAYESISSMRVSDHKPVFAIFSVAVKPGFDTLPLSGAKFKKDVFVKAAQKRARYLLDRRKRLASTACTIT